MFELCHGATANLVNSNIVGGSTIQPQLEARTVRQQGYGSRRAGD
jgi:hypothetical protein